MNVSKCTVNTRSILIWLLVLELDASLQYEGCHLVTRSSSERTAETNAGSDQIGVYILRTADNKTTRTICIYLVTVSV
jgi:hypothetical protein